MEFSISISGIDYVVDDKFINSLEILEEKKIGDTYFITCSDAPGHFVFSISSKVYEILKLDKKIDNLLG